MVQVVFKKIFSLIIVMMFLLSFTIAQSNQPVNPVNYQYGCFCAKPKPNSYCYLKNNGQYACRPFHSLKISEQSSTTLAVWLEQTEKVSLKIFDNTGRVIKVLVDDVLPAGDKEVDLNQDDLPYGIYLLRLQTSSSDQAMKIVVDK